MVAISPVGDRFFNVTSTQLSASKKSSYSKWQPMYALRSSAKLEILLTFASLTELFNRVIFKRNDMTQNVVMRSLYCKQPLRVEEQH